MSHWKKVGKIKDAHGLKGDLYALIFSKEAPWADDLKTISISKESTGESENESIENFRNEYVVKTWKPFRDGLLLRLEGVNDRTAAEKLKGQMLFVPEDLFDSEDGETIYLSEILHFQVCDSNKKKFGTIVGFSWNGAQDLLLVQKTEGGQAEIPFVEDFIVDIDFEAKILEMDLPEGIWDLQNL